MSFIEVRLPDWDCSKVTVGVIKEKSPPTILYDGKLVILTIVGTYDEPYVVSSYKGLERQNKYNPSTKTWTNEWTGEWELNIRICNSVDGATPMQRKLMDIFDDIKAKIEEKVPGQSVKTPINYKYIKEEKDGFTRITGIDRRAPAYMSIKVPYTADEGADTIEVNNKMVPVFEARRPKPQFFNVAEAKDRMLVEDPDRDCRVSMNLAPKIMISLFNNASGYFITRRLMGCYYEPTTIGGSGQDDELINMLAGSMQRLIASTDYE